MDYWRFTLSLAVPLGLLGLGLSACGDDATTVDDEIGDEADTATGSDAAESDTTDEAGTTESETESDTEESDAEETESESDTAESDTAETDTTESETGGGDEPCDAPADDVTFSLVGAAAPADGCADFTFEGQHFGGDLNGVYNLDACPCGGSCLVPDPYTLALSLPDAALLPTLDECPTVHLRRDPDTCEAVSLTIETAFDQVIFVASHEPFGTVDYPNLAVTAVNATECAEDVQYALEVSQNDADEVIVLSQGQEDTIPGGADSWFVHNYASRVTPDGDDFDWVGVID